MFCCAFCGFFWEGFIIPEGHPELRWMNQVWHCSPNLATLVLGNTWRKCCKTNLKLKGGILLYTAGSDLLELAAPSNGGDKNHQLFYKGKDKLMDKPLGTWQGCLLNSLSTRAVDVRDVQGEWLVESGWACTCCLSNASFCHNWRDNTKLNRTLARLTRHFTPPFRGSDCQWVWISVVLPAREWNSMTNKHCNITYILQDQSSMWLNRTCLYA